MINQGLLTSNTPEWYTPPDLAQDIEQFLGVIHLDPCADPEHRISAHHHLTHDGLAFEWRGKVFMNPPYGRDIGKWVQKALTDPLDEIVMLLPARTDTAWFAPLFAHSLCFIRGRLKFSGSKNSAPFPSVLVYRGPYRRAFCQYFAKYGVTL